MHPVLAEIGPLTLRWYGVMIATGVMVGLWLAGREGERKGFAREKIYDFAFYVIFAGILGARIYFVLFSDFSYFLAHPLKIIAFWEGGLAIHGAVIVGIIAAIWFTSRGKIPFWRWTDTLAPSLILGQAIGRIGCFLNGDAHGIPTTLPWGLVYSPDSPAGQMFPGQPLHPTQLYELGFNLIIFVLLWKLRKKDFFDGFLFLLYVILYSSIRIFVEHFRADQLTYFHNLSAAQTMGAMAIAVSIGMILVLSRRSRIVRAHQKSLNHPSPDDAENTFQISQLPFEAVKKSPK
jgi:phosphatidylglycerol:prolipoprotein diacylglycerol transferase